MKSYRKILYSLVLVVALVAATGRLSGLYCKSERDIYAQVRRNLLIFGEIFKEVNSRYVEEVEPEKFLRAGIRGMLERLDPYSMYLDSDERDEIRIMTQGKYYGVGMRIVLRNGWATVAEQPFPNSPAARAGIREGDQIVEIDGKSTQGETLSKTAERLRGRQRGSEITIKIRRIGESDPLTFRLLRDEIVVSDIQYAGFVEPGVGLIRLNSFSNGSDRQLTAAIENLLNRGMEKLILDLRGNPGGLLEIAVSVLGNFVPKGELVVYTQGRDAAGRQDYRTRTSPIFASKPLIVLVDGFSASASEIVAGAIQDLDRGAIIGNETFGKGLVQTVIPLDRSGQAQLRLTTALYYLPSGRLIQRADVFDRGVNSVLANAADVSDTTDGYAVSELDSALALPRDRSQKPKNLPQFSTRGGRIVYGGGGIKPDIEVENPLVSRYVVELVRKSMFFNFSLDYATKHPELPRDFEVTDEILRQFNRFLAEKKFDFKPDGFEHIENLENIAREEQFFDAIQPDLAALKEKFQTVKEKEKEKSLNDVKFFLKRELASKLYGGDAGVESTFASDPALSHAIQVLGDSQAYRTLLQEKQTTQNK